MIKVEYCWVGLLVLLAGCAGTPVTLEPVGPAPTSTRMHGPEGYLVVYSATADRRVGDGPAYHPHTSYIVYNMSGAKVRSVQNHAGNMDEAPQIVRLPFGYFQVRAEAEGFGWVTVPVVIRAEEETVVRLDGTWTDTPSANGREIVRLPNGRLVGWRAHDVPSK